MSVIITHSEAETKALAARLAKKLKPGDVVAMFGTLGGGKTTFVAGALKALGYEGVVNSPTYAIVNEYRAGDQLVAHFDMYRIETEADLMGCGFYDAIDSGAIIFVEWGENIEYALDGGEIRVSFAYQQGDPSAREITLEGVSL